VDKKGYTLIIVSPDLSRIKQYRVSRFIPRIVIVLLSLILIYFCYTQYYLLKSKKEASELASLEKETRAQKAQIRWFAFQINELKEQLDKLNAFESKLRVITNIQAKPHTSNLRGMGGPESTDSSLTSIFHKRHEKLIEDMGRELNILRDQAKRQEESFHQLEAYINSKRTMLNSTPAIWPVRGLLTCGFESRISPFTGLKEFHQGLDIAAPIGTPIVSPADGVVVHIGLEKSYGRMLTMDHGFGFMTRYGHIAKATVKVGEKVKRGQTIALVGDTGRTTGPHLHYEVHINGIPVNPLNYILD
jgi:septal ring factor EnvC (AmiA/AmiB activator)